MSPRGQSGILVALIEEEAFQLKNHNFDIYGDESENKKLIEFLRNVENGKLVVIVTNSRPFEYVFTNRFLRRTVKKEINRWLNKFRYPHFNHLHSFTLVGERCSSGLCFNAWHIKKVKLTCDDMDASILAFNDRSDSTLDASTTYSYYGPNFHVDLTGWTKTKIKYKRLFNGDEGDATATVRGLNPPLGLHIPYIPADRSS